METCPTVYPTTNHSQTKRPSYTGGILHSLPSYCTMSQWSPFLRSLDHVLPRPFSSLSSFPKGSLMRSKQVLYNSASQIGRICFQTGSVEEPGSPVLGVAFLFRPPRIRMPKVLCPEQTHSLCKRIITLASQYFK